MHYYIPLWILFLIAVYLMAYRLKGAYNQKLSEKSIIDISIPPSPIQSCRTATLPDSTVEPGTFHWGAVSRNVFAAMEKTLSSPVSSLNVVLARSAATAHRSNKPNKSTVSRTTSVFQTGSWKVASWKMTLIQYPKSNLIGPPMRRKWRDR